MHFEDNLAETFLEIIVKVCSVHSLIKKNRFLVRTGLRDTCSRLAAASLIVYGRALIRAVKGMDTVDLTVMSHPH